MATAWISFGPDLEPLEGEARRGARTAPSRRDGVTVRGEAKEVVAKLVEAGAVSAGWCRLEEVLEDGGLRSMFVNAAAVRLVADEAEPDR
jgi:hypothetical protein